ncbi:hypothetical protein H8E77_20350 [bacterium]|nr:hypothetical protein [bacterium]
MSSKPFYNLDPITYETNDILYTDSKYVDKLYTFLTSSIEPPFSLSINGSWGSGKTTLMKELQKRLESNEFPVLWFNPWEYERADDTAFCFLIELNNFAKSHLKDVLKDIGICGFMLLLSSVDLTARLLTNNKLTLENTGKIYDQVEASFTSRYDTENSVEIIKNDFAKLTKALAEKHNGKPLIVFLDDLDRCLPDKALDLLEALKNLFIVPNAQVIFISGIDTQVAKQFIIKRYEGIESEFAYNYFKKIFNFTVNLPVLTESSFRKLIKKRLNELMDGQESEWSLSDEEKSTLIEYLSKLLVEAGIQSIRQAYNILQNCYFVFNINPDLQSKYKEYMVLFAIKERNPGFFEECCQLANKNPDGRFLAEVQSLEEIGREIEQPFLSALLERLKELGSSLENRVLLEI